MTRTHAKRSRLMVGCGSTALALALVLGVPQRAAAQGIAAGGNVVVGSAEITTPNGTTTQVDVFSPTAVIDWTPDVDNSGNALDFLRTGATAIFRAAQGDNFAVLNRILPTQNNNIVVINGSVLGQVRDASGQFVPGGFLAFYSPTGILVGETATFDVGSLLLTTLDTTPQSFDDFVGGGFLTLQGQPGSTARVQVNPRARISALAENSFFAVVAADVQMSGTARVNGTHAYVAGEVVNLRLSNGLFDISIPVGTAASGQVVTLDGNIGGPSSTGAGDNHMIYALARASQDPISMLFSGNLGFDPAQSAGVINGEIILAANYDVSGRDVDTGSIRDDFDSVEFRGTRATSDVRADITLRDLAATSNVLAIGTGQTVAETAAGNSSYAGNLWLVGSLGAAVRSVSGGTFTIDGDVLVDARDYGVVSSSLQSLDEINATGGTARIVSSGSTSVLTIGGRVTVTAEAFGGAEDLNRTAGSARGGLAEIAIDGGQVTIGGLTNVRAGAFGTTLGNIRTGAEARGGTAQVLVSGGGQASFGSNLFVLADATGANGDTTSPSTASDTFGGNARIAITGSSNITVRGDAVLSANAFANASSSITGPGALADAGEATIVVDRNGVLAIEGALNLLALASGGQNVSGSGGLALGGVARMIARDRGLARVGGTFLAEAGASGGGGVTGGDAFGGVAGALAESGTIELGGNASADASASGGNAEFGVGGTGGIGRGGTALFQAVGSADEGGRLAIAGLASVRVDGRGGDGRFGGEGGGAGGAGGDGLGGDAGTANQADPTINGGAYLLADGDFGELSVGGNALASAQGTGGTGGAGATAASAGRGGNGTGGTAQAGVALLSGTGALGDGTAGFAFLTIDSSGFGGSGGLDASVNLRAGRAGDGSGGNASLKLNAGAVSVGEVLIQALGAGGTGGTGGTGLGGTASVVGGQGGRLDSLDLSLLATGSGGFANLGRGGDGIGGRAAIETDGTIITLGSVLLDTSGTGGTSADGAGGEGLGGDAFIGNIGATAPGSLTATGHTQLFASGQGGESQTDFAAGNGTGGRALVQAQGGTSLTFGSLQAIATGRGGTGAVHEGGDGFGGQAELVSIGAGSRLIVQRNVPTDLQFAPGDGAILNADGFGGSTNGGDGFGGDGNGGTIRLRAEAGGGIELPLDPAADIGAIPVITLTARGFGGSSSVEGGTGGLGGGGFAEILADGAGSRIITGQTVFTVFSQGGNSGASTSNVDGGTAFGGSRQIRVLNGAEATLGLIGSGSGGIGGDGSGTGDGGDAFGGRNEVEVRDATLNVIGVLTVRDEITGGSGQRGGDAISNGESGVVSFSASGATINFTPDGQGQSGIVLGGAAQGGLGFARGGDAQGASASFNLSQTDFSGGTLRIETTARGGDAQATDGVGGDAESGFLFVDLLDSNLTVGGELLIANNVTGGDGALRGGNALPINSNQGPVSVTLNNSSLTVNQNQSSAGILRVESIYRGGEGATSGNATGARVELNLARSTVTADELFVTANAFAERGQGGIARAGEARVSIGGTSQIGADLIEIAANAVTGATGQAFGGTAVLQIRDDSDAAITAGTINLFANASGSTDALPENFAGRFVVDIASGVVNAVNLTALATGDRVDGTPPSSVLSAISGIIAVADTLSANATGNIRIETGQAGFIGTPANTAQPVTVIDITSQGAIAILGDDDGFAGLRGDRIRLTSRQIDILPGARIAAAGVVLTSLNTDFTAILGGNTEGEGWSLTADEARRITGSGLTIRVPEVTATSDPDQPDLIIRDLSLIGSQDGGFAGVSIRAGAFASGIIRIEGDLALIGAGLADELSIRSGERIELVTPGSIRITDEANALSGILSLQSGYIWVADADMIAQLRFDPEFAGRDALLAVAAPGSNDPLGYIRAREVNIALSRGLLVRNTGTALEQGGILVGNGGLSIIGFDPAVNQGGSGVGGFANPAPLDVFAYGRRLTDAGTFITGE
uniref:beta strand repeat-containing protein n=1 Tax=Erythrobacter donghaensis TaxID=267135 RepID=UPI000A395039